MPRHKFPSILGLCVIMLALLVSCNNSPDVEQPASPDLNFALKGQIPIPPPPQETNAHVVVYGGTHTGAGNRALHRSIIYKAVAFHASHIFNLGDLTEDGTDAQQWADFMYDISRINRYQIDYYPALGEHEDPSTYFSQFPDLPTNGGQADPYYYYVEHLTSLFIVLDISSEGATAPAGFATQKAWLENVLQSHAGENVFRFVFFHVPSMRTNGSVGRAAYAAELDPIFQQYGVDIVFMGHSHTYQRWNVGGVHYVVTGGAGAPLDAIAHFPSACVVVPQVNHYVEMFLSGDNGTYSVKDMSGNELDALTLVKGQPAPPPPAEERVAIHGDTHGGQLPTADAVHAAVVARILAFDPDIIFNTGDVVEHEDPAVNFGIFNGIRASLCDVPYYPTLGNHDSGAQQSYFDNFPYLPQNGGDGGAYYYVDSEFARFIVLEVDGQRTNKPPNWEAQKSWLSSTLNATDDVFKFVFFHVPLHSVESEESRGTAPYAEDIATTLNTHGVHAVFTGHIHSYQRFDSFGGATNTKQIVTGGAGGFLHQLILLPPPDPPEPLPPFLQRHNYLEMVLTENVATIEVYTMPDDATSGPFTLFETIVINK